MTPERWQRLQELFDTAMELPTDQRDAFLNHACGQDVTLRRQAESLIFASDHATNIIEAAIHNAAESAAEAATSMEGQRIGPYQVIRELGRGGMGAVYLALRADDEYRKRVAIKVVKRDMADKEIMRRFLNERQILASLDHPHIARLLDGGTTKDGLPYVVMEYIEGEPIDAYCDQHRLSVNERLNVFRTVCSAVHYAHQNLVIHRDIKPGNILVTSEGEPKLLDFGIAKLLNPELASRTQAFTGVAMRLMTPEYASPEQVRGESVTTVSDVYSLGVLLYELLTGHRPYHFKNYLPQEIERVVSHEEPERPSTVISREEKIIDPNSTKRIHLTPTVVSQNREAQPEKLRRRLEGELDDIVMMALRKESNRRYASAEQLSEDIRRHLEGMPVLARPATYGYRASKFVQRHKIGVVAAALVLVTLMGGILSTAWEARLARIERTRAERRFNDVRTLANSFLFEFNDSIKKLPGSVPAQELVVKRALEYLDSLAQESSGDQSLQRELAKAYIKVGDIQGNPNLANLGDTAGALQSYRKSLAILEPLAAADPTNNGLRADLSLGYERMGDVLDQTGNTTSALEQHRRALSIREALVAAGSADVKDRRRLSISYSKVANLLVEIGDPAGALEYQRNSLAMDEAQVAADPNNTDARRDLSVSYEEVGNMLLATGDAAGALDYYRKSLAMDEAQAATDPNNAEAQHDLSMSYYKIGNALAKSNDLSGALEYHRKSLSIAETLAAADPTNAAARRSVAVSYIKIGDILATTEQWVDALSYYRKSLDIFQMMSTTNPASAEARRDLAFSLMAIGDAFVKRGDPTQALKNYRQAQTIREALAAGDPKDVPYQNELAEIDAKLGETNAMWAVQKGASVSEQTGRWREAQSWYQKSLKIWSDMRDRKLLSGDAVGQVEKLGREMAKCDAALTKLTQRERVHESMRQ